VAAATNTTSIMMATATGSICVSGSHVVHRRIGPHLPSYALARETFTSTSMTTTSGSQTIC
jgi:hypothetical protein